MKIQTPTEVINANPFLQDSKFSNARLMLVSMSDAIRVDKQNLEAILDDTDTNMVFGSRVQNVIFIYSKAAYLFNQTGVVTEFTPERNAHVVGNANARWILKDAQAKGEAMVALISPNEEMLTNLGTTVMFEPTEPRLESWTVVRKYVLEHLSCNPEFDPYDL